MFTPRRLLVVATAVALLSGCASPNPYDGSQGQANDGSQGGISNGPVPGFERDKR